MKRLVVLLIVINACILLMKTNNQSTVIYVTNHVYNNFFIENQTADDPTKETLPEREESLPKQEEISPGNLTNEILLQRLIEDEFNVGDHLKSFFWHDPCQQAI
jgi:hypothetical protein